MFTNNDYLTIGKNILKKREDRGLSQGDLAEKVSELINEQRKNENEKNLSYKTIGNWESGNTTKALTLECLSALCKALDCDFHYLLNESNYDTKEQEVTCKYTGLSKYAVNNLHDSRYSTFLNLLDYLLVVHYHETTRFIMNLYESITDNYISEMTMDEYRDLDDNSQVDKTDAEYYQHVEHYRLESDSYFLQCERALHNLIQEIDYKSFSTITDYLWTLQAIKERGITESYEKYISHFGGEITEQQLKESYKKRIEDIKEIQDKIDNKYNSILNKT